MADTLIGAGIVEDLRITVKSLDKALATDEGRLTEREATQAWLSIAKGVLMTIDNHYRCPALRFYLGFEKWLTPIIFGLVLIAILGGIVAFERFGMAVPAP